MSKPETTVVKDNINSKAASLKAPIQHAKSDLQRSEEDASVDAIVDKMLERMASSMVETLIANDHQATIEQINKELLDEILAYGDNLLIDPSSIECKRI